MRPKIKCLWCRIIWPEVHATRIIAHLLQQPGLHLKPYTKKIIKTSLIEGIPKKLQKNESMKAQSSQLRTCKAKVLVTSWSSPMSCPSLNEGQTTILRGFDWSMSSNIRRINNTQLEMATSDFFYCENTADRVVESTRFEYMMKKAWLVGDEFRPPTRKIRGKKIFILFV